MNRISLPGPLIISQVITAKEKDKEKYLKKDLDTIVKVFDNLPREA